MNCGELPKHKRQLLAMQQRLLSPNIEHLPTWLLFKGRNVIFH